MVKIVGMSFVSFNQKDLARVLTNCNLISPRKSEIDLFTYTKVFIGKESAEFTSINSTIFFNTALQFGRSEVKEKDGLSFLIKTDLISNAVNLISDDMVGLEIDLEKSTLIVQGASSKHTLRTSVTNIEDFVVPQITEDDIVAKMKVNTQEILEANKVAFTSVGNPKVVYQPEFLNICYTLLKEQNQMIVVSTDRYRMGRTTISAVFETFNGDAEAPINYLINPKNIHLIANCVVAEENLSFLFGKDYLTVTVGANELTMRYGDGKFPDYDKIIPSSFSCSFYVNTKDTLQALKQVYFAARSNVVNKNVNITISPANKKITLVSKTDDGNSSESTINMENYEGVTDDWTQSFNADYLIDYISTVNTDTILWESNPGKPSVLSPAKERERQLCLVSGLR